MPNEDRFLFDSWRGFFRMVSGIPDSNDSQSMGSGSNTSQAVGAKYLTSGATKGGEP